MTGGLGGPPDAFTLIGRDTELGRIDQAIGRRDSAGIVLVGAQGVGTTHLARRALAAAHAAGHSTTWVIASETIRSVPFGAFAPVLPAFDLDAPPIDLLRIAVRRLAATAGGRRVVLAVDNADQLDDGSAAVVTQLWSTADAFVLATLSGWPNAGRLVRRLWPGGQAEELVIRPLDDLASEQLLTEAVGGPISARTLRRLCRAGAGFPALLAALVRGGVETGVLRREHGLWRWRGSLAVPETTMTVESWLARLSDAEREVLELVVLGEPVSAAVLESIASREPVEALERLGLVAVHRQGARSSVRVTQPLCRDVVLKGLPPLRGQALTLQLVRAIEERGARRDQDALHVAKASLAIGIPSEPERLVVASRTALRGGDPGLAAHIGRAAIAAGGGGPAVRVLVDALVAQGQYEAAAAALNPAGEVAYPDAAIDRAAILFWAGGDADAARNVLAGEADIPAVAALEATFDAYQGFVPTALARAGGLTGAQPEPHAIRARLASALALAIGGRPATAAAAASEAVQDLHHGRLSPVPGSDELLVAEVVPLLLAGKLADAQRRAEAAYAVAVDADDGAGVGLAAAFAGRAELAAGRVIRASDWLLEATFELRQSDRSGLLSWTLATLAHASALLGWPVEAREALREAEAARSAATGMFEFEVRLAKAWLLEAVGDRPEARLAAIEAAVEADSFGQDGAALIAWHTLARLGGIGRAALGYRDLRASADEVYAGVLGRHIEALAANDVAGLSEVATQFEAIGAALLAAEAWQSATRLYQRAGNHAARRRAQSRMIALVAACQGARTPALADVGQESLLTKRERQVAELVAGNMSSRDIAEQLVLSVRTVDNHLQHVYSKLGVNSRNELAALLASMQEGRTPHAKGGASLVRADDASTVGSRSS